MKQYLHGPLSFWHYIVQHWLWFYGPVWFLIEYKIISVFNPLSDKIGKLLVLIRIYVEPVY